MRIFVGLFLTLLINFSVWAEVSEEQQFILNQLQELNQFNQSLSKIEDDEKINALLKQQNQALAKLMSSIRASSIERLPQVVDKKRLNFLENRITVNKEKGHLLAIQRDAAKIGYYQTQQALYDFILYLITAAHEYDKIEDVVTTAELALKNSKELAQSLSLPKEQSDSPIYAVLEKNHADFTLVNDSYQDLLLYASNNPRQIIVKHWLQTISLTSAIAYVNHFEMIKPINHNLSPFKIDIGGITLSCLIVLFVYFSHPFVFRCTRYCVETYILEPDAEHQEFIYLELRKPLRTLLVFFGLDLATYAFFYKTDYRPFIESLTFVFYVLIYVWFFFRLLDSCVLLKVRRLNLNNKELRRELFNLGVQVGKGVILIIALTICLNEFGINITAIVSTLGIGGLAFALAAKDTLSNLFGGMSILFDNIFRLGDWVRIGDVEGTIAEIGLRSTTIRTFDNALIIVPNASVSVSNVQNWNRRAVGRRIKMYIGVTYESEMQDIRQALKDIREMLMNNPDIANPKQKHQKHRKRQYKFSSQEDTQGIKSTQLVFMDRYNDFSIDILIYCFSKTVDWEEWLRVKEDLLFKIAEILEKNNLEFAYPTQVRINRPEASTTSEESFFTKPNVDSSL